MMQNQYEQQSYNKTTTFTRPPQEILKELLEQRGYRSEDELKEFFSWNLKELPNLQALKDIRKAAEKILTCIQENKKIAIYGDYDVDGTTSCALLYHFFQMIGVTVELIQPSRFIEGYGIHPSSIDKAIELSCSLVITVDCGITNCEAADYALEKGIDLIITDHHKDACDEPPKAYAIVNPNRRDEPSDSPLKALAGVGVAFALSLEIKSLMEAQGHQVPSIYSLLQFVAVGTISDLAKLTPMNIKLVRHGLKQLPQTQYPGLRSFLSPEERELDFTPSEKVSFKIGPLINSKGRLEHPEVALKLLVTDNPDDALMGQRQLEICNNERKFVQAEVFKEAKEQALQQFSSEDPLSVIVYAPEWHEGVIGIVASKLVENFNVPALVFSDAEDKNIIKASVRSAGELNVFDALKSCEDLFIKFGGHKAAAGLSMPKENLVDFKIRFNHYLSKIPIIERTTQLQYDLYLNFEDINLNLIKALDKLEPFGMGNTRPVFRMKNVKIESFDYLKDVHVRWTISSEQSPGKKLKGISFFYVGKWNQPSPEEIYEAQENEGITIQFQLGLNRFNGREYLQLLVDKVFIGTP